MRLPNLNRSQLAFGLAIVVALAIVGGIAWGFGQQLTLARQMQAEETRLEQTVAAEQAHHDELVVQLEHVRSDEYVEHWARAKLKMAKRGEVAVVVVTDADEEPADDTQPIPTPKPESQPFWVELWELLFAPSGR